MHKDVHYRYEMNEIMKECPFLGLEDDPGTRASFPSIWNCCYHVKPVEAIDLTYQKECCLSGQHLNCPVYLRKEKVPLPDELRISQKLHPNQKKIGWKGIVLIVIVFVNLILALLNIFFQDRADTPQTGNRESGTVQFAPPISTGTFEMTQTPKSMETRIETLAPTSSPSMSISTDRTITPP